MKLVGFLGVAAAQWFGGNTYAGGDWDGDAGFNAGFNGYAAPQYQYRAPPPPAYNNNGFLNTYITASALSGTGLGSSSTNGLLLASALSQPSYGGGYGGGSNPIGQAFVANSLGGGLTGAIEANALTQPSYGGYGGGFSGNNNLGSTLLLSSALGGTGTSSSSLPLALAVSGGLGGGYGGYGGANPIGQAVVANSLGGGLTGAVEANALTGNGGFGFGNNLASTVALSSALGGSSLGSSDLTPLLLASSLSQPAPAPYYGGYGAGFGANAGFGGGYSYNGGGYGYNSYPYGRRR